MIIFLSSKLLEAYGKYVGKGDNKDMKQESHVFSWTSTVYLYNLNFPIHLFTWKMNSYKLFTELVKRIPIFILQNKAEQLSIFCLKEITWLSGSPQTPVPLRTLSLAVSLLYKPVRQRLNDSYLLGFLVLWVS